MIFIFFTSSIQKILLLVKKFCDILKKAIKIYCFTGGII